MSRIANTESQFSFFCALESEPEFLDIHEGDSLFAHVVLVITENVETSLADVDEHHANDQLRAAEEETMVLSDTVKHQVDAVLGKFCERRIPPHARHQVRMSYDFRGDSVTLFEDRVRYNDPTQWTHMPIAQFRHAAKSGEWTLFSADRNDRWHRYPMCEPTRRFEALLEEVDRDPTGIFFG